MAKTKRVSKQDPLLKKCKDYGLDIGAQIRTWFQLNPNVTITSVAEDLHISKVGFYHRMNNPYYSNAVDLLELSLLLKHDFISPVLQIYRNKGRKVEETYTAFDVLAIKDELEKTKEALLRSQREVDGLYETLKLYRMNKQQ
ncbi:MAG: hypothetical protein IT265_07080 [Saprospiraceae bacterium]|nr:hypothetical protein [Saprospiraceae bacterium]